MPKPDKWVHRWPVVSESAYGGETYNVALARDGTWGCSCKGWIFQKARPREDCKHILRVKREIEEPPLPWPGAWAALGQLPKPPDREPPDDLFLRALVEKAEREYIERGYMHAGSIGWREIEAVYGSDTPGDFGGYFVRQNCQAFSLELPPERRLFLLHEHNLLDAWQVNGSCFYYTAYHGEVFQVWRALTHWELCLKCRKWTPGDHDCRPEPWMAYLQEDR